MKAAAFPLFWPHAVPRAARREKGPFRTSYIKALQNVVRSLSAFGKVSKQKVVSPVVSMNVDLQGRNQSGDPGVAVWFTWDGLAFCIAVDRYTAPAANLQAIHYALKVRRLALRSGMVSPREALAEFAVIPPTHWSNTLGISPDAGREEVESAFRRLAKAHHPDGGGSAERMTALNVAREAALREAP